jgi:hypothetical protein
VPPHRFQPSVQALINSMVSPTVVRKNLFAWQDMPPDDGPGDPFYVFCDTLEVKDGKWASAKNIKALLLLNLLMY